MRRSLRVLAIALSSSFGLACGDSASPNANTPVSMQDNCDPTSFNAGLGPGTCVGSGTTTLTAFNNELAANHSVAAWRFVPTSLTVHVGGTITAINSGGEVHTFTEVDHFGGGIVPALNDASGNSVEAEECKQLSSTDHVQPGAHFTTDAATDVGTELYQCCIHPWMRATVTVVR